MATMKTVDLKRIINSLLGKVKWGLRESGKLRMALNVLTYSVEDKQISVTGASRIRAKRLLFPPFVT